jgi:hypothetical protein
MRLDLKAIDLGPIAVCAVNDARLYQTSYVANGAVALQVEAKSSSIRRQNSSTSPRRPECSPPRDGRSRPTAPFFRSGALPPPLRRLHEPRRNEKATRLRSGASRRTFFLCAQHGRILVGGSPIVS